VEPEEITSPEPAPALDADIVCVGFGPATGGFLTTLTRAMAAESFESRAMPGMPLQVVCYERADDIAFGVSGVVTRGRAIRASFPDLNPAEIPMATRVSQEKLLYLLDPHGASRRPALMKIADGLLDVCRLRDSAWELPYTPPFFDKHDGFIFSLGQFNQWVGQQVMMSGLAQIWPMSPVAEPLVEDGQVRGVILAADGTEVRSELTVAGDGPIGPVGRRLDDIFGMPPGHQRDEWAAGMKFVVDLPEHCELPEGTVLHTLGYPEPEIFGFLYVHPQRTASVGLFIPSWMQSPVRTAYRYLQHFIEHPYLKRHLRGAKLRSWGAKSILESGRRGEPWLCGDGYARIGEGSGSTNVLTASGVDEAWLTGMLLGEAVLDIWRAGLPFSRENLDKYYVARRRASWLESESHAAEHARNGFQSGVIRGFLGMALSGFTNGRYALPAPAAPRKPKPLKDYYAGKLSPLEVEDLRQRSEQAGEPLHNALMDAAGWPRIQYDGELLISHQDALLMGGKVQAPPEFPDHVVFRAVETCRQCGAKTCVEMCSGQAIHRDGSGGAAFDREKCVHCGVCLWNCEEGNIVFAAAPGGLHSAEN
jgi:electron-transferring-flavoprotein dehydrogenase